ncbi:branched-chain amino acid ABC transporter permease [Bosea rubneri]|uniref:Branched-chain amino acid ABC transporter permease n=1 Tax=Bosea rubneri TaxID=3075434 RepID=A0ABU3S739_9HYPH|nr:branched-chain amino acid ABC transporter permease [Bosea sp. ZW T0_25]MDU0340521.1 branched-chain amino acid ABC transporter permease [Bosea sp. ZW T0_25]
MHARTDLRPMDSLAMPAARPPASIRPATLFASLAAIAVLPFVVPDFWLSILNYAGIAAVGAIGLNLLTGSTGQVSLGQPFFMGVGCYVAAYVGQDLGLPLPLWLAAAVLAGGLMGALVGPAALRLRGHYLVIVTLGLVLVGLHLWQNLPVLTGGANGRSITLAATLGPLDFSALSLGGAALARNQGWFILIWLCALLAAVLALNLLNSRAGRAFMAIRDREMTASVIGISVSRTKIVAFVISSMFAAAGGALYGGYVRYAAPVEWDLLLGVQYLAMIVVGGTGSVLGSVLGALFITLLPQVVKLASPILPFVSITPGDGGVISLFALNQILFGSFIIGFLMFEPRGIAGLLGRIAGRFDQAKKN